MPEFLETSTLQNLEAWEGGVGYGELSSRDIVNISKKSTIKRKYPEEVPSRMRLNVLFLPLRLIEESVIDAPVDFVGIVYKF